jgi:hypothetical protein
VPIIAAGLALGAAAAWGAVELYRFVRRKKKDPDGGPRGYAGDKP